MHALDVLSRGNLSWQRQPVKGQEMERNEQEVTDVQQKVRAGVGTVVLQKCVAVHNTGADAFVSKVLCLL